MRSFFLPGPRKLGYTEETKPGALSKALRGNGYHHWPLYKAGRMLMVSPGLVLHCQMVLEFLGSTSWDLDKRHDRVLGVSGRSPCCGRRAAPRRRLHG